MKATKPVVLVTISIALLFLWSGCGGDGSPHSATPSVPTAGSVSSNGGTIAVNDPNSPIHGVQVQIPANALPAGSSENISIDYQNNLPGPAPTNFTAVSKTLVLTKDNTHNFQTSVSVTVPVDPHVIANGQIPVVLYWAPLYSAYRSVPITNVDTNASTITFQTAHFSWFTLFSNAGTGDVKAQDADTGFKMGVDSFLVPNFSSYDNDGQCIGMANYADWYFSFKKSVDGTALYNKYKDDATTRELIVRAWMGSNQFWVKLLDNLDGVLASITPDALTANQIIQSLLATKEPQTLGFFGLKHAVTIYRWDATNQRFEIYDNNFPGGPAYLYYNEKTGFSYLYNGVYPYAEPIGQVFFIGSSSTEGPEFENLYKEANSGFTSTDLNKISVTSPALDSENTATVDGSQVVTIAGKVTGGIKQATLMHVFWDSPVRMLDLPLTNGQFSFPIPASQIKSSNGLTLVSSDTEFDDGSFYGGLALATFNTTSPANPAPSILSVLPSSLTAGSTPQVLTLNGTGFLTSSAVTFNGVDHPANFVTNSQLTISLSSVDLAAVGTFPVVVTNPSPGGGSSSPANFTVGNPVPSISGLSPSSLAVGAAAQTLTINGTGFDSASSVTFNGVSHTPTFVSASQLTISLSSADLATVGTFPVVVTNPAPGGGASAAANFSVTTGGQTAGMWTWMGGSNIAGATGVYGTLGIPAAGNVPGAREGATSWTDNSGNLWFFGGVLGATLAGDEFANDLWEFNPTSKVWTWVSGADTINQPGVYGTQGVPAAVNIPGAREYAVSWRDNSGNLWLFGGIGVDSNGSGGMLNDLWEFNPTSKVWTWVSGADTINQPGVYGTQGVPAAVNVPGAREYALSWSDNSGNLWLFGGGSNVGTFSDLWEFDPSSKVWTWVSGADTANQPSVYGTLGVPAASNTPGARVATASWSDNSGNLWLFGGDSNAGGVFSDLWEFNPTSKVWTWVSGADTAFQLGVYGTLGVPAAGNVPGAREFPASWSDNSGNLWLFGGSGFGGTLNDLWEFNPTSKVWTWVSGADTFYQPGVYGTLGVPAAANVPGARFDGASWRDNSGNLWLFGGYVNAAGGLLNDLWRYQPPVACGTTHYNCSPSTITSTNQVSGPSKFTWTCSDGTTTVQCSQPNAPIIIEN